MPRHVITHPLVQDALAVLRRADTTMLSFRQAANRISFVLASEATRDLPTRAVTVETPLGAAPSQVVDTEVVIVPVLRAGLSMLDPVLELIPKARVGHLGLERDEMTAIASTYYAKLPEALTDSCVLIVDPMLATGGSAVTALDLLRDAGARDCRLICIIAASPGVAAVEARHPDVPIYTSAIDDELNARKFIVPGLGDFGDRLYGTD